VQSDFAIDLLVDQHAEAFAINRRPKLREDVQVPLARPPAHAPLRQSIDRESLECAVERGVLELPSLAEHRDADMHLVNTKGAAVYTLHARRAHSNRRLSSPAN